MTMGFGSYDESDQGNQDVDTETDGEAVNLHENDHEGEVTYDSEASTDSLLDQLEDIKAARDDADDED